MVSISVLPAPVPLPLVAPAEPDPDPVAALALGTSWSEADPESKLLRLLVLLMPGMAWAPGTDSVEARELLRCASCRSASKLLCRLPLVKLLRRLLPSNPFGTGSWMASLFSGMTW